MEITLIIALLLFCAGIWGFMEQRKEKQKPIPPPYPGLYETINDFLDITFENEIYTACVKGDKQIAIRSISSSIPYSRAKIDNECIVQKEERIAYILTHGYHPSFEFISPSKGVCKTHIELAVDYSKEEGRKGRLLI